MLRTSPEIAYRIEQIDEDGNVFRTSTVRPSDPDENDVMVRIGRRYNMDHTRVVRIRRRSETVIHDGTRPLTTVENVTAAIREIVDGPEPRRMKTAERQARAGRLADLYDVRGSLWRELGIHARMDVAIPDAYALACAVAEKDDRESVRFWRKEAQAR